MATLTEMAATLKAINPENKPMALQYMAEQWWPDAKWLNASATKHNGGAKRGGLVAAGFAAKIAKAGLLRRCWVRPVTYVLAKQTETDTMNTGRIYKDIDGLDCTIHQMVSRESGWAAARTQKAEEYEALLKRWHEQGKPRLSRDGNSPNHSHSVAGIWDSDNGDIAGHECAECALFEMAKRL